MKISYQAERVKCELGSKNQAEIIDAPISGDKVMKELESIHRQYGDQSVIVELSEAAADALKENMFKERNEETNVQFKKMLEKRATLLQSFLKPAQKLHQIIPNIKTNEMLESSLMGANQEIVDASYSIINNNFLPHDIGKLTEEERIELISVGLEETKYLAQSIDSSKRDQFMEAMSTIAKYGVNGKADANGKVTYDIRWGTKVGEPDDNYVNTDEIMREIDPESYEQYTSMYEEALRKNDISLFQKAAKFWLEWSQKAYQKNPKPFEDAKKDMLNWKNDVDKTQLDNCYTNTDMVNLQAFMDSITSQRKNLDSTYLANNLKIFADIIQKSE